MLHKNDFYIYLHKLETGLVFYLGKGRGRRSHVLRNRSRAWRNLVNGSKVDIEYLHTGLSYEEAIKLEENYLKNPDNSWRLVNIKINSSVSTIGDIAHNVYYDNTSPTFLRWADVEPSGKKFKGGVAGSFNNNKYCSVMINGKHYQAHRVIWYLFNRVEIPEGFVINHIDCNPSNNDISNLEMVSHAENNNKRKYHVSEKLSKTNTSGINGIYESRTKPRDTYYYNATVTWFEDEVQKNKSFSYLKYGKEKAWELAKQFRDSLNL